MKDALVGFNTNVTYQGRALHIQTEDSGRGHPHVITHLYVGGAIVATRRTAYDDLLEVPDLPERVRALMKAQHKAMILEVRDGLHDVAIAQVLGAATGAAPDSAPPPGKAAVPETPTAARPSAGPTTLVTPAAPPPPAVPAAPLPPPPAPAVPAAPLPPPPAPASSPSLPPPSSGSVPSPLPSRPRTAISYRPPAAPPSDHPDVVPLRDSGRGIPAAGTPASRARRFGSLRPPARREREGFGKDLISDRSLDAVILSYLAEELTKDGKDK